MAYQNLILEKKDGIATLTFNRPKALNALSSALFDELSEVLAKIETDADIRVLVLTGAGDKAFVAGADISELVTFNPLQAKAFSQRGHSLFFALEKLPIPVVAAVNGFALGGGLEVALSCDMIYASTKAKFGVPEITLGLIPGFGGTQRLPRVVGKNIAKEMIYTGKMIRAEKAAELGMVNKVCDPESLMDEVAKLAGSLAAKGSASLRGAKQAVNNGLNVDLVTGCAIEADAFGMCVSSQDAKEGTQAFLEKRKPDFKGSLKS
jgi:enoyl-CoA hydratase